MCELDRYLLRLSRPETSAQSMESQSRFLGPCPVDSSVLLRVKEGPLPLSNLFQF